MGKNKKAKAYIPEAFKAFGLYLENLRQQGTKKLLKTTVNLIGLENAINLLSKEDRETIEKFWGLTGGTNHSKKLTSFTAKDVAFIQMRDKACQALSKLNRLDLARMYDDTVDTLVEMVNQKLNMSGCSKISEMEAAKYLIAFLIVVENGPKMSFEQDPMLVRTNVDRLCYMDEYEALNEMCQALQSHPDHSINLWIVKNTFEMMDLRDYAIIQKTFGLKVDEDFESKELEVIDTFSKIRHFKERVFEYGPWDITCKLVLGFDLELEMFLKEASKLRKDWSKLANFETGKQTLKTSCETRELVTYTIGDLEFTDPYEVMCLYLTHKFLENKLVVA